MMACHFFVLMLILVLGAHMMLCKPNLDEPTCTSRYDFESRLLKDMVKLNFDMEILKQRYSEDIEKCKAQTDLAHEKLESLSKQLERTQTTQITEMTALENDLKLAVDNKIQEVDASNRLFEANITKALEKSEQRLIELRATVEKPPVAFLVRRLSDTTSGKNKILKFTVSVYNTNSTYDHDTGYFMAPLDGTYIFSLQLCPRRSMYVNAQIFANSYMIGSATLFEHDGHEPCSTVTAVAILTEGDRVCAKLGSDFSKGNLLYQDVNNRWAAFMGTLVN